MYVVICISLVLPVFIYFFIFYFYSLETGPPTQVQPQKKSNGNGWRQTNLASSASLIENDKDFPVAPPRRKRSSLLCVNNRQCGFKELFGNTSRRSSSDSILSDHQKRTSNAFLNSTDNSDVYVVPVPLPITTSAAAELLTATTTTITVPRVHHRLQRKISRVGNKKSDKFFGENLSDCLSDEPVTPEPDIEITTNVTKFDVTLEKDKIDEFIDKNVVQVKDTKSEETTVDEKFNSIDEVDKQLPKNNELDKRAEFFITMLENTEKKTEIEPTPPKRRNSRPISIQMEAVEAPEINVELKKTETIALAKELEDDAEKYRGMTPVEEPIIVPRRRQSKHICDDDEILQHNLHKKIENSTEHQANREITVKDINDQIISPKKPKRDFNAYEKSLAEKNEEKVIVKEEPKSEVKPVPRKRHLSQGNLLAAAEKLSPEKERPQPALRKSNSQQSFFHKELVRKLDKAHGSEDPYDIHDFHHTSDDGCSAASPQSKLTTPRKISRKESTVVPPIIENPEEKPIEIKVKSVEISTQSAPIKSSNSNELPQKPEGSIHQDQKEEDFSGNANTSISFDNDARKTAQFLQNERQSSKLEIPENCVRPSTPPLSNQSVEASKSDTEASVLDSIYAVNSNVLDEFHKYLENDYADKSSIANSLTESSIHSDSLTSSDETGSDITVKEVKIEPKSNETPGDIRNKLIEKVSENENGKRRGSINDVDEWFLKHKEYLLPERRGSTNSIGYDTRTVFPFGKPDAGAGTKFFENQNDINGNLIEENNQKASETDQVEHSTLLKYLQANDK